MNKFSTRILLFYLLLTLITVESTHKHKKYDVKKPDTSKSSAVWSGKTLKIMSFNTWNMAIAVDDGINKIAKHILLNSPDVVGLQEVRSHTQIQAVVESLNHNDSQKWSYLFVEHHDTGLITKHTINISSIAYVTAGVGAQVVLDSKRRITVWSMHLDYTHYGPYFMMFRQVYNLSKVDHEECKPGYSRCANIKELVTNPEFKAALARAKTEPLFVVGDFNAPSHLDYTKEALPIHFFEYTWPATFILQNTTGLVDSFRELYPDVLKYPGASWSTINQLMSFSDFDLSIPEPQDRIDFIFYKSSGLKVVKSGRYAGDFKPYPAKVAKNDWPSDHYAYISEFKGF